jgi:hypothetical protein
LLDTPLDYEEEKYNAETMTIHHQQFDELFDNWLKLKVVCSKYTKSKDIFTENAKSFNFPELHSEMVSRGGTVWSSLGGIACMLSPWASNLE